MQGGGPVAWPGEVPSQPAGGQNVSHTVCDGVEGGGGVGIFSMSAHWGGPLFCANQMLVPISLLPPAKINGPMLGRGGAPALLQRMRLHLHPIDVPGCCTLGRADTAIDLGQGKPRALEPPLPPTGFGTAWGGT